MKTRIIWSKIDKRFGQNNKEKQIEYIIKNYQINVTSFIDSLLKVAPCSEIKHISLLVSLHIICNLWRWTKVKLARHRVFSTPYKHNIHSCSGGVLHTYDYFQLPNISSWEIRNVGLSSSSVASFSLCKKVLLCLS